MRTILEALLHRSGHDNDRLFLSDGGHQLYTVSDILRLIRSTSIRIGALGVSRTGRVAIILPDGIQLSLAFLSVANHCAAAPLNPKASEEDLFEWLDDLRPDAILTGPGTPDHALTVAGRSGLPLISFDISTIPTDGDEVCPLPTPNPADTALILHTSGTTAKSKMVPLTHANLMRSAGNVARTLQLSPEDLCLNVVPMFHIHGIVTCLLGPLVSGGGSIIPEETDTDLFFSLLLEKRPTWYSAVPTRHTHFLERAQSDETVCHGHGLRLIRSSSAALPLRILEGLEKVFGVPVIEAYGMTEAAHQMCSSPLPPGMRKPGSVGMAAGPEVAVADEEGRLLPVGVVGEVVIRGENVSPGYLNLPPEKQGRLHEGWFRTGDLGRFDADGYLYLVGRVKEIVNRGGEKVSPLEVDAVLHEIPEVAEAACFGIPHPTLGEDLVAAIRLHPGQLSDEAHIRDVLFSRLSHYKIPSRIVFVDSIPKSSIGKVQRSKLAVLLHSSLLIEHAKPLNKTEEYVAEVFRQSIPECGLVGRNDHFFSLGGDSLQGIHAVQRIGGHFKIELPAHEIFRHPTPALLGKRIEALRQQQLLDTLERRLTGLSEDQLEAFLNRSATNN